MTMTIEEVIKKLEDKNILDLKKLEYIRLGKLKTIIFAEFDIEFNIQNLKEYMINREEFIELGSNFFCSKIRVKELLRGVSKEESKKFLEARYITQIDEDKILSLLNEQNRKYEELLKFGLNNSYIDSRWLSDLNLDDTNFNDVYEVIDEFQKKGIEIK